MQESRRIQDKLWDTVIESNSMDKELGREFSGYTGCHASIKAYIQILNTQVKCQT